MKVLVTPFDEVPKAVPETGGGPLTRDIQAAQKLLGELWEAYHSLPRHSQVDVKYVLSGLAREQAAQIISRKEGKWDGENLSQRTLT